MAERSPALVRMDFRHLANTLRWLSDAGLRDQIDSHGAPTEDGNRCYWEKNWANPTREDYAILDTDGEHVGNCGLSSIDSPKSEAELWIYLGENRGRGMGSWAVRALIKRAFNELGLNQLRLRVVTNNPRAAKFYLSLGFKENTNDENFLREKAHSDSRWFFMVAPIKTVAILQPGYIPWLGFFDQVIRSDVFVYYDDVQFDKHGWRNRNRIKSPDGPFWLTVPVKHRGINGD